MPATGVYYLFHSLFLFSRTSTFIKVIKEQLIHKINFQQQNVRNHCIVVKQTAQTVLHR